MQEEFNDLDLAVRKLGDMIAREFKLYWLADKLVEGIEFLYREKSEKKSS
jgi:hypothetical protein